MTTGIEITRDSVIGDVIREIPGAENVIREYFGNGCFTCPGLNVESIAFGSTMHNVNPEDVVTALKKLSENGNGA